jgi:predicted naringenin-chalcone synthase
LTTAYLNRIATAVPPHDVHEAFVHFARSLIGARRREGGLFERMVEMAQIEHRFSSLSPRPPSEEAQLDTEGFYVRGHFPDTASRMRRYEETAPALAANAVERLELGAARDKITHLIVTTCTGLSAPGLDLELVERCRLDRSVERTMVGFMGCYAAINALKLARHILRSEPASRVLLLNLELCTLHMQETRSFEQILAFLLFGDGCAASLVTVEPEGLALDRFRAVVVPGTSELITWNIRELGFDMVLSGRVPGAIGQALRAHAADILDGAVPEAIEHWAVHPGGRSVLDAVERALALGQGALAASREILRRYGNMSSATIMFVLESLLRGGAGGGGRGCAMSFGPGLTAETMLFRMAA